MPPAISSKLKSASKVVGHRRYLQTHAIIRNRCSLLKTPLRTALFFPGHGVQRVGMASPWADMFPRIFNKLMDDVDKTLGYPLSQIMRQGPNWELNKTENSQPAIMATSILILRILEEEFGFSSHTLADVTLGHSLGEFTALVAGGFLEFGDALRLVRRRAEIMSQCTKEVSERTGDEHGMIALVCEPDRLPELLETIHDFLGLAHPASKDDTGYKALAFQEVMIANVNSNNQIVLSGNIPKIRTLIVQLRQFGGHDPRAVKLKCESPFHNPIMAPAADYMRHALEHVDIRFPTRMQCVSNVSGLPFTSREELKTLLSRQCVETVRWWDSIRYLDQEHGVTRWIGIGPGKVGQNLVGKGVGKVMVRGGGVWSICNPQELQDILSDLQRLVTKN
ncbi:ACP S-malonyltransferase [Aspergillus homomorphus CBS 101889]|uniref:[acyl-carrier-protein] S-malonyltransferase n=1 Tax=Aspergillus homomorphus (strain CBS 101889) TaxID=1450537 RepID=A0A395IEH0_ASPHC|nr:malonyl CoA-acyl carrier protein transacylase [Aspergillus homomorphus CBS 101889]RAL16564.1 malonyl CoA-acyl carrier protein transacylase [Aspergillus homomorphus CBS 101889]